ncbi:ATP-binding cassette domain-containing protein [Rhodoplanes serenus]|jgi:branched-chain amino acid transport system ATP-binding protein|uniref:ATP-binding cassette domain-containing protein n=1 Tax=Rhodoplanes serenus TaxID=200615 RepID=A0A327KEG7_9BRAD|nr:ABC transporter ATP-binding protein [Rhodoplanes serenus]MTW18729.1 ATP-binding cassette domain-containing protein [Rhodoplanes serenus]RAI36456.1 ABC transporter ATP-binding protein [Rhodoplanes serenus]
MSRKSATGGPVPVLVGERLTRHFGGFVANRDVTVALPHGKVTSIIGPNGAGKSTLFNMLTGTLAPTSGRLLLDGDDITGLPQHRYAGLGIAKSFQITSLFPGLSVIENVVAAVLAHLAPLDIWSGRRHEIEARHRALHLLEIVGLTTRRNHRADALSHGEQRSLEVAVALACDPVVLLLDEPTAGMSPEETRAVMALIRHLAEDRAVGLVEHKMGLVMEVSDTIYVLHQGEVLAHGSADEIQQDTRVREVYLGAHKRRAAA